MDKKLEIPNQLYRFGTSEVGPDGSTIRLSISSDQPYRRYSWSRDEEYYEVLDHSPEGMDTSRLKAGTSLLYNHDRNILIGRNESFECDGHKCYVESKISKAPDVESYRIKIDEGILKASSVGYSVADKGTKIGERDGIPILKFRWCPNEASLVTIEADTSVGIGRQLQRDFDPNAGHMTAQVDNQESANRNTMAETVTPPTAPEVKIDVSKERNEAVTAERKRVSDIQELSNHFRTNGLGGRKIDTSELAAKYINGDKSARDFQDEVVRGNFAEAVEVRTEAEDIGMGNKEKKDFSFLRAIYNLGTGRGLQGLEKEASDTHAKQIGHDCGPNSFYVPMDIQRGTAFPRGMNAQQRALFTSVYSGAGALVGTELLGASLIELLRNQMVVVGLGARSMSGLVGNVAVPRQTGGATASWLAEDSTITANQQTVGQLNLTPHKLAAATAFTEQLAMQSSVDAENFVRQDLMAVAAIARDLAAISGTGVSGQPVGIFNLGSSNLSTPVTLSAAQSMTYANAVNFELNVSLNNANKGKLGYLVSPTVKNNAKLIAEISSTNSNPVWKDDRVNGYPAVATNQHNTGTSVIFGNWDDLILADWATSNFFVDPYSLSMQGQIRVINRLYCDNGVRHGTSFSISVG